MNLPWEPTAASRGFDIRSCHEKIRAVVDYWQSIHPTAGLPGRQHMDPTSIPELLANLRIIDVERNPMRFKTRLMGTLLREFFEQEHTGRYFDIDFPKFEKSKAYVDMVETVTEKRPNWYRGTPILYSDKNFVTVERIFLPLAGDGESVDMILTYILFGDKDGNIY